MSHDEFWQMKEELAISQGFGFGRRKSKIESNEDDIESERTEASVEIETSSLHSAVTTFIQERYRHIVDNTINSVLFIIKRHDNGVEVSGHIDLNQRFIDDPNFQKYLKGLRQINPQQGDLTYHHWTKGKTLLSNSDNWEIVTESGKAELRNRHSGDLVGMDILQSSLDPEVFDASRNKRRGKMKPKLTIYLGTIPYKLITDSELNFQILAIVSCCKLQLYGSTENAAWHCTVPCSGENLS